jgi:hypothetical protein
LIYAFRSNFLLTAMFRAENNFKTIYMHDYGNHANLLGLKSPSLELLSDDTSRINVKLLTMKPGIRVL